jgi:hypothetical protein
MHLTGLSEKRPLSTILLRRAAVMAIRKRLKRPLVLDARRLRSPRPVVLGRGPGAVRRPLEDDQERHGAEVGIEAVPGSSHSVRAGMMTAADLLGIPMEKAMEHRRWKSYSAARI